MLVHVQSNFFWGGSEAMLLVVNIVTSPIGTDCGWSAPVVEKNKACWELLYIVEIHVQIANL